MHNYNFKVFNIFDYLGSTDMFRMFGCEIVNDIKDCDVVCLNGGEDIATEIYGQEPVFKGIPKHPSKRDRMEMQVYEEAKAAGKFVFGICRGAQLVNCLNGGTLWQHVTNHQTGHTMFDIRTQRSMYTTSAHHQMMIPGPGAEVLAVASEATKKVGPEGDLICHPYKPKASRAEGEDIEVLWYPSTRSLLVQGHPEWASDTLFARYCFELIESLRIDGMWPSKAAAELVAV